MMTVSFPLIVFWILRMAFYTSFSLFGSRALVASSRTRIWGRLMSARAIAILYFCPPERFRTVLEPT